MEQKYRRRRWATLVMLGVMALTTVIPAGAAPDEKQESTEEMPERTVSDSRFIVTLGKDTADLSADTISTMAGAFLTRAQTGGFSAVHVLKTIPVVVVEKAGADIGELRAMPGVVSVVPDGLSMPNLASSTPVIQAKKVWSRGFAGNGFSVAVLDSGVQAGHPFLQGKVKAQACFTGEQNCPNGQNQQIGGNAGKPCADLAKGCSHGTHVAGIAAGNGSSFDGVARGGTIVAIQVFDTFPEGLGSYDSSQMAALDWVRANRTMYKIAAANLSLGGGAYTSYCNNVNPAYTTLLKNLRADRVFPAIASGNEYWADAIAFPACMAPAVAVGATDDWDNVAGFSNSAETLDLLAPGVNITSSVVGGGFDSYNGTSMATPHVAGAVAVLKQARPGATVSQIEVALKKTGKPVLEPYGGVTKPRIRLNNALNNLVPGVRILDSSVLEGNSGTKQLRFTVRLSRKVGFPVAVTAQTLAGTATAPSDFVHKTARIKIPAGTLQRVFSVTVKGDTRVEPNEKFRVRISKPANGVFVKKFATGTIRNND